MRNIWQERAVQKVVAIPCLFVRITFCIHTSTKHLLINFRLDVADHDKKSRDRSSIETETREVKHTRAQQPLTTFRYYTLSQLSEETSAFLMVCDCSHTVPLIGYSLSRIYRSLDERPTFSFLQRLQRSFGICLSLIRLTQSTYSDALRVCNIIRKICDSVAAF
jgi:hypothetical protein